ncbi:hypothetical protein SNE40_003951 [Patella caerulea]|uniref:Prolyl 4-hydroxylase alpha subunit domain-containing protein n=1 Tax=Patella caerulea TaxID=87958 RepID=A0AAN8K8Y7_PATCE
MFSKWKKEKREDIVKKDIELPGEFKDRLAFGLYNVFTPKECQEFIDKTEKRGYEVALLSTCVGDVLRTDIRKSARCIWDTRKEADRIWSRIKDYVCTEFKGYPVIGLNERLRFLRYTDGDYFKPHFDGCYQRENGEKSSITIQLYLNEGFKGGSTTFISRVTDERVEFVPKTGAVLIFEHKLYHEGSLLEEGLKYSCRTDVMFGKDKIPE